VISNIGIYNAPQVLDPPSVNSKKYAGSFQIAGKLVIRAIAFNPANGKSSPERREEFDIPRKDWKLVDQGEFSNIKNNPVWQLKRFTPVKARYMKPRALSNTQGDHETGYAEVDLITG
jgi:hypothetical protein